MASVILSWSANPLSDNVTAYEIWGANGTSVALASCTKLATVSGLTWTDTGLPNNQARTYYIKADNVIGSSAAEGPINITTSPAASAYVQNAGGAPSIQEGLHSARPAAGNAGAIYLETDTLSIFRDNGTSWDAVGSGSGVTTVSTTGGTTNLTLAQCELGLIVISGTLTSNATVNFGSGSSANLNREFVVINNTTGAFTVTLQACATSPSGSVKVAQSASAIVYTNGATLALANSSTFTSTQSGPVPASGGGTTNFLRADGSWAAPGGGGGGTTAPTIVQKAILCSSSSVGTVTFAAAPTAGNVLIAIGARWNSSIVNGTGWNRLVDQGSVADDCGVIFWKLVGAGESATQTFSTTTSGWDIVVYEIAGSAPSAFFAYAALGTLASSASFAINVGVPTNTCLAIGMFFCQTGTDTFTLSGATSDGTGSDSSTTNGGGRSLIGFHGSPPKGAWQPSATITSAKINGYSYVILGGVS